MFKYTEFETKYRLKSDCLYKFKAICESLTPNDFIYAESDDKFFYRDDNMFVRHRSSKDGYSQLTLKKKLNDNNNINRIEYNVMLEKNYGEELLGMFKELGLNKTFTISKYAHIYNFNEATLAFYTVKNNDTVKHFAEIEVNEEIIGNLTEKQAWEIIRLYEDALVPLGIKPQSRLKLSLYEMYKEE
jgi:adenylate cyclase class IV